MITYLKGTIEEIKEQAIVLEVYGMGYEIFCSAYVFQDKVGTKEQVKICIYEHIKEDAHDLYGFQTAEERELFKKLISVSGIGPKGGMQILSTYPVQELLQLIVSEDTKALSKVSGIGPKTAQRIVLELKDSLKKIYEEQLCDKTSPQVMNKDIQQEAIEALMVLGYSHQEAKKAVQVVDNYQDTSEQLIKKALSLLGL